MTKEQVWELYGNAKAKHPKFGEGTVVLAGLSEGQVWIEVKFQAFSKVFVEPFGKLEIEVCGR